MKKRVLCITLALVSAFALLSACGGGSGGENTAVTPPPQTAPAQTAAPASLPTPQPDAEGRDFSGAPKINLSFAIFIPDADPTTQDFYRYLELIKEYTEGTVDYTMYAAQSLCNGNEGLDAVKSGLADMAYFYIAMGSGSMPVGYLLEYPGISFNNDKAAAYTFTDWFNRLQPKELDDFKFLFAMAGGNGGFISTVPIRTFEDFSGKQIRCGAAQVPVISAYGANPVILVIAEVYEALRTGVLDASSGMLHGANSFKLFEVTQYVTVDPYYMSSYVVVMNKDTWNSMTPDQQAAFEAATEYAFDRFIAPGRYEDGLKAIDDFTEHGLEVIRFADEDLAKISEVNSFMQESYAASVSGGSEALALLNEIAAKFNAIY